MTKAEAMKLENRCDKIMSKYWGENCTMSMALNGKLKVIFNDGDYITWSMVRNDVDFIRHAGWYDDLVKKIAKTPRITLLLILRLSYTPKHGRNIAMLAYNKSVDYP